MQEIDMRDIQKEFCKECNSGYCGDCQVVNYAPYLHKKTEEDKNRCDVCMEKKEVFPFWAYIHLNEGKRILINFALCHKCTAYLKNLPSHTEDRPIYHTICEFAECGGY